MITSIKSKLAKIIIAVICVGIIPTAAFAQDVTSTKAASSVKTVSSVIKVTGMRIDTGNWDRTTGTLQFIATIYPANATNKNVVWTSSNPKVIKIDNTGKAVMVGIGDTILTCKATDGSGVTKTVYSRNDYIPQK